MKGTKNSLILACVIVALGTASSVRADFLFGRRVNLGPVVNSAYDDWSPFVAADGLSLYFISNRPGGLGGSDIWVSTRATVRDAWGPPVNLGEPVNSGHNEYDPFIAADGLTLAFSADTPGGLGGLDIRLTTRATKDSPWGPPVNLGSPVNTEAHDAAPCISSDGCSLYFHSARGGGGWNVWMTSRVTMDSPWSPPRNLGLDSPPRAETGCWFPRVSADGLALFFDSDAANRDFYPDIWVTTRTSNDGAWGLPVLLGREINTGGGDEGPSISADGSTLYFFSYTAGVGTNSADLWQSTIYPIVDFNGDKIVDMKDLLRLIESWGKDDPAVDMGPMPWGDGKVDRKDLEVLMSDWGKEVYDPALLAHWMLDETSGTVAADSAGESNGVLQGDPTWQPTGGKKGGALRLDGVDDYVEAPFVHTPVRPFSVFAWVQGGAPGQVILAQVTGNNWLRAALATGQLQTELNAPGRNARNLTAPVVITDGAWHRVGLVWDSTNRVLYVDDAEVARDTPGKLPDVVNGLYLGAGSKLDPGTFWSGLIDEVRIYNQAVKP